MKFITNIFFVSTLLLSTLGNTAFAQYKNYNDVLRIFTEIQEQNPNASLTSYGTSEAGRNLYAMKWNPSNQENLPKILISAAIHGDEWITTESLVRSVQSWMLDDFNETGFSRAIQNFEFWIIPIISPDSFTARSRIHLGRDPNRSFPGPGTSITESPLQIIQSLINFSKTINPVGIIDLHAFGEVILLPWAHTFDPIPVADQTAYDLLSSNLTVKSGYNAIRLSDFLRGSASGGSLDFWYSTFNAFPVGIEIGTAKVPPLNQVPVIAEQVQTLLETYILTIDQLQ